MRKNIKSKAILYLEVDDKKKKIKISFPNDKRKLVVNKIEAAFLANALSRQIQEWAYAEMAAPKENFQKYLTAFANFH